MSPLRHGRLALALAALLALALIVASCGGDEDSGTGGPAATVTSSGRTDDSSGADEGSGGGAADDSPDDGGSTAAGGSGSGESTPPAVLRKAKEFGSEASGSEAEEAEAALLGYLEAQAGGEWSRACSYLAKELRQLYGRFHGSGQESADGCPGIIAIMTEGLSPQERTSLPEVDIQSVRLEGRRGYIVYTDSSGTEIAKPILDEAGQWKLSSLLVALLQQSHSQE